jgi:hypothetical protein
MAAGIEGGAPSVMRGLLPSYEEITLFILV